MGVITEADVETALQHLFSVRMREPPDYRWDLGCILPKVPAISLLWTGLGHFDPKGPLQEIPESAICSDEHAATARAGAAQGSTLLKNDGGALPLKKSLSSVAVIGPNGDLSKAIAGCKRHHFSTLRAPLPSRYVLRC